MSRKYLPAEAVAGEVAVDRQSDGYLSKRARDNADIYIKKINELVMSGNDVVAKDAAMFMLQYAYGRPKSLDEDSGSGKGRTQT